MDNFYEMATPDAFVDVSGEEINFMKENAILRNTKHATKFGMTLKHFIYLREWFQQQTKFTTDFETMEVNKMNISVMRKDRSYYKRNGLLSM